MSKNDATPPVTCTLTEDQAEQRSDFSVLTTAYEGAEERDDGYTLRFDGNDETLLNVAKFVSNERQCCSFADYHIDVSPPYNDTRLTIAGPEGTKELVGEGLINRLEAEAP